jgi:xanthine/CO dehydrogenase XdhC/CoxF family maturation factor
MSQRALLNTFTDWQQAGQPLALVTVVATEGSTYSKAGRHLIIRMSGEHAGLVSGGCLEGDLAEHAREVMSEGGSRLLTYDMRDDADALWGMGVGCNGLIEVLLQKLDAENQWAPFTALADALSNREPRGITMVIESEAEDIPAGSLCVRDQSGEIIAGTALPPLPEQLPAKVRDGAVTLIHWQTHPWPRLLILGAGPDAEPVCSMAGELGWQISVADHRPALLEAGDFAAADERLVVEAAQLASTIDLDAFSACLVMSHHLDTDSTYMQQLAAHFIQRPGRYLGVLGPAARREKILSTIQNPPPGFAEWLRGPVGLDIGADSPEGIALSVLSEIQACDAGRPGGTI